MPSLIGTTSGGVSVAANYLKVQQSPGAALNGLNAEGDAPLLTFSTPNLRAYKVSCAGVNLSTNSELADSNWSRAVRAVQVTSEVFAIFAPTNADPSVFIYLAPDFNTNPGTTTGDAVTGTVTFGILETALNDAISGCTATVTTTSLTGVTWS